MDQYYFTNPEEKLTRETSHPFFVEHATADFYYSLGDEFSPFGNDAGADTLFLLQEWFDKRSEEEDVTGFLLNLLENNHPNNFACLSLSESEQIDKLNMRGRIYYDDIDSTVIAVAFGQCKISGIIDNQLVDMANKAIVRQIYLIENAEQQGINPWVHAAHYLQRLKIMQSSLAAMTNKKAR